MADRVCHSGPFRARVTLQAKIFAPRHQLNVLGRKSLKRVAVGNSDRLVFCGLYRFGRRQCGAGTREGVVVGRALRGRNSVTKMCVLSAGYCTQIL
jgi:hypothetical protein